MGMRVLCGGSLLMVLTLAACGGSSDSKSNEQALGSLERTTEVARLQSETGQLVDALSTDPSDARLASLRARTRRLRGRAARLTTETAADPIGPDLTVSARETGAGLSDLGVAERDLASDRASRARRRARAHLKAANLRLRGAVDASVGALGDPGQLSAEQRTLVARIRSNLTSSDQSLEAGFAKLGTLISQKQAAAQAAAAAAAAAASAAASQGSGGCPPGTTLSPDGQLCSNGEPPSSSAPGIQCQDVGSLTLAERQVCCTRSGIGCD